MVVDGRRQPEKALQDHLHGCVVEEILAAHDMGDALVGIVEGRGEEVGDDGLAPARQHHIPDPLQSRGAVDAVTPGTGRAGLGEFGQRRAERVESRGEVEPQRIARPPRRHRPAAAGAGVDAEGHALLRRRQRGADVRPGAGAGVEKAPRRQRLQPGIVAGQMLGLAVDRAVPGQPQPAEVVDDLRLELGARALEIGILHAQQEPPAGGARHVVREDRREGVAEVQRPGGRGGEAGDEGHGTVWAAGMGGAALPVPRAVAGLHARPGRPHHRAQAA